MVKITGDHETSLDALITIVGVNKDFGVKKRELERCLVPILGKNLEFNFATINVANHASELKLAKQQLRYRDAQLQKKSEANDILNETVKELQKQLQHLENENRKALESMISSERQNRKAATHGLKTPAKRYKKAINTSPSPDADETPARTFVSDQAKREIIRSVSSVDIGLLNPFGEPLMDADIQYAFEKCDQNADKRISMKEFLAAMDNLHLNISAKRLKEFFNKLDTHHTHSLSLDEFREGLKHVSKSEAEIWQKMLESDFVEDEDQIPDVEKIKETLSKTNTDWRFRISAMHSFMKLCCKKQSKRHFDSLIKPVKEPLLLQLGDRRSAVVRECCIVIAKVALTQTSYLTRWAARILEVLFETMRIHVEIISMSAHQAARAVCRCVPETKRLELTNALLAASTEPYIVVRERAYQYIQMMLHHTREENLRKPKEYWAKIINGLLHGLQDPATEVREAAMCATCEVYFLNEDRTQKQILSKVRKKTKEHFYDMVKTYEYNQVT